MSYTSPAVERMLGYAATDRVGHSMLEIIHPDDEERARHLLVGILAATRGQATAELRSAASGRRLAGARRGGHQPARRPGRERHRAQFPRRHRPQATGGAAHRAGLPRQPDGLANRALFVDRVAHALTRSRDGQPIGLLFLDLDDFKSVNDLRGHSTGDRLLVAVGDRVRSAVRDMDSVARLGGDEFAVLIEDAADRQRDRGRRPADPGCAAGARRGARRPGWPSGRGGHRCVPASGSRSPNRASRPTS